MIFFSSKRFSVVYGDTSLEHLSGVHERSVDLFRFVLVSVSLSIHFLHCSSHAHIVAQRRPTDERNTEFFRKIFRWFFGGAFFMLLLSSLQNKHAYCMHMRQCVCVCVYEFSWALLTKLKCWFSLAFVRFCCCYFVWFHFFSLFLSRSISIHSILCC